MKPITPIVNETQNALAGHGYTLGQILEIGEIQRSALKGDASIPQMVANNASSDDIHDLFHKSFAGYKISKFEANYYHVLQEKRLYDSQTGERISKPNVQIYNQVMFDFMVNNNGFTGMLTHVLHNPRKITGIESTVHSSNTVRIIEPD